MIPGSLLTVPLRVLILYIEGGILSIEYFADHIVAVPKILRVVLQSEGLGYVSQVQRLHVKDRLRLRRMGRISTDIRPEGLHSGAVQPLIAEHYSLHSTLQDHCALHTEHAHSNRIR